MNATERAALLQSAALFDELHGAVDERTLEILDRRRRTAVVHRRGWLVRRALCAADVLGLVFAFLAAEALFPIPRADAVDARTEFVLFLVTLPVWIVAAKLYGLYDADEERTNHSTVDDVVPVFHLVTVGAWVLFAGSWVMGWAAPNLVKVVVFWGFAVVLVSVARAVARSFCRRSLTYLQNTVIVGAGDVGQAIARKFVQHGEYGINLVGFVDAHPRPLQPDVVHVKQLGPPERLPGLVRLLDIERIVVAFSTEPHEDTLDLIRSLKDLDVQVDIVPRLFEVVGPAVGIHTVEGVPLLGLPPLSLSPSSALLKRALDVAVAACALALLAPVLALVALLIKRDSRGPVLFRQVRMGANEETFEILKFRTMVPDAEERKPEVAHLNRHGRMFKLDRDPRVTRLGSFLRRYSIDELPQLVNVLRGEMSVVGPRPLILDEDHFVDEWGRRRLNLKPGITGPWQVLGRNDIPFEEMVKLDYLYVTNWSLWNDLGLILKTIPIVARGGGH